MKTVSILVYEDVVLSSAAAPLDIFSRSNDMLVAAGKPAAFAVELVGARRKNVSLNNPARFLCTRTIADAAPKSDGHNLHLVIVPAFSGAWDSVLEKNRAFVEWIRRQHSSGTEIASLCKGSYFLAEAGLLNGKPCTSHWAAADDMRTRYPEIEMQADTVITDQDGIYTGGGAFSSLSLVLYLVEKFCGHDMGIMVSKNFSIHRDHLNQAHFAIFRGQNQHDDKVVLQAQSFIEENYGREIGVEQVAMHVNMSKRNFIRRFKQATHFTPLEYIQRVKIEAAKKALEGGRQSIQTLMYDIGYNDIKTFRDVFKRITGITPQSYRDRYGRM